MSLETNYITLHNKWIVDSALHFSEDGIIQFYFSVCLCGVENKGWREIYVQHTHLESCQ